MLTGARYYKFVDGELVPVPALDFLNQHPFLTEVLSGMPADPNEAWKVAQAMSPDEAKKRFPPMWVIYDHPRDFPHCFVVRCWYGAHPLPESHTADTLIRAREIAVALGGSVPLQRFANDQPQIVEVWV